MNHWYVARSNELFIDTDNVSKSLHHTKARLQGAIEYGRLSVRHVKFIRSRTTNHAHTIITLQNSIPDIERYVWEVMLHGDIYRACCNIMRLQNNVHSPDILIMRDRPLFNNGSGYARLADDVCNCTKKHNKTTMENCRAAIRLRGDNRTRGFFGKPSKNPCTLWPDA